MELGLETGLVTEELARVGVVRRAESKDHGIHGDLGEVFGEVAYKAMGCYVEYNVQLRTQAHLFIWGEGIRA